MQVYAGKTNRVEIPLVPAVRVAAWCRMQESNKPLADIVVSVGHGESGGMQHEQTRTDAEGRFEAFVLPGPVRVQVITPPANATEADSSRGPQTVAASGGVVELARSR